MMAGSGKPAEEFAPNGTQIMDDGQSLQVRILGTLLLSQCVLCGRVFPCESSHDVLWVAHRVTVWPLSL